MTPIERLAEIYRAHDKIFTATTSEEGLSANVELIGLIETQKVLWGDPNAAPPPFAMAVARGVLDKMNDGSRLTKHRFKPPKGTQA